MNAGECKVCGIRHDREVHAAVLSVRRYLRARIERLFQPPPRPRLIEPPHPNQFYVRGSGRP
jgi:hypothetical protein